MAPPRHDAEENVGEVAEGDLDLAAIVRAEGPALVRFLRRQRVTVDDAQDLTQEAILRFWRVAPTTRVSAPRAYLRQIAANLLRNHVERASTKLAAASVPLIEGLDVADQADPHRALAGREELAQWGKILGELKPRTLEIFLLSRVDRMTYREIADHFGMTVWNVERHVRIAIAHVDRNRRGV